MKINSQLKVSVKCGTTSGIRNHKELCGELLAQLINTYRDEDLSIDRFKQEIFWVGKKLE